jgi:hypothetical protein
LIACLLLGMIGADWYAYAGAVVLWIARTLWYASLARAGALRALRKHEDGKGQVRVRVGPPRGAEDT